MNDIQSRIAALQGKGWTLAALADELNMTPNALEKWKAGDTCPANRKATIVLLDRLVTQKHVPPRRRYGRGSRRQKSPEDQNPRPDRPRSGPLSGLAPETTAAGSPSTPGSSVASAPDAAGRTGPFRKSPIFSDLDERHLAELSRLTVKRNLKAGQFLFFEGEPAKSSHLIVTGVVKLLKHSAPGIDFITGVYGPGEMLGSTLLFLGRPHSSSAQAVVDTTVLSIGSNDLIGFLQRHPDLNIKILGRMVAVAGQRRQAAMARLRELAGERVERRLARVLWALYLALGPTIPLTRREIAEMTGTTSETTARFVSRLTRTGVVQSLRGKIVVVRQRELRQLAEAST